jgi:TolB protein
VNLTNDPAADFCPAWSPDGSKFAFATDRDGPAHFNYEIYVANADGSDPVRLTDDDSLEPGSRTPAMDRFPNWSPDGSRIAFESNRDGGVDIYVMNADGTDPVKLTSGSHPAWSPDGSRIAFDPGFLGGRGIMIIDADGTNPVTLTSGTHPAWSPDGAWIAFVSDRDGNDEIYVIRADGTGLMRLTDNAASDYDPVWRPRW